MAQHQKHAAKNRNYANFLNFYQLTVNNREGSPKKAKDIHISEVPLSRQALLLIDLFIWI